MSNLKTFNNKKSPKSGFTLIELSIVLIIIGLLVAGVTGGASLIKSAQLRSLMSEARGYTVAVNSFKTQYDKLPGDYGTAINGSGAGNNNGQLRFVDTLTTTNSILEGIIAWNQLRLSNTIDTSITNSFNLTTPGNGAAIYVAGNTTPALTIGTHIPSSKVDGVGWAFDYNTTNANNVLVATGGPIAAVTVTDAGTTAGTTYPFVRLAALSSSDALSVDTKMDDGVVGSGKVRGITTSAGTCVYTGGTTRLCAMEFSLDS